MGAHTVVISFIILWRKEKRHHLQQREDAYSNPPSKSDENKWQDKRQENERTNSPRASCLYEWMNHILLSKLGAQVQVLRQRTREKRETHTSLDKSMLNIHQAYGCDFIISDSSWIQPLFNEQTSNFFRIHSLFLPLFTRLCPTMYPYLLLLIILLIIQSLHFLLLSLCIHTLLFSQTCLLFSETDDYDNKSFSFNDRHKWSLSLSSPSSSSCLFYHKHTLCSFFSTKHVHSNKTKETKRNETSQFNKRMSDYKNKNERESTSREYLEQYIAWKCSQTPSLKQNIPLTRFSP